MLPSPTTAHLVGISGAGMQSLARVLRLRGWQLTGSDVAAPPAWLAEIGILCAQGHSAANVPADARLLVYSQSIGEQVAERRAATERRIPQFSYAEMLGQLMHDQRGLAIAGTHGKSTTAAMLGSILTAAGRDPTVVVGASQRDGWPAARHGNSNLVVAEACEYRGNFWHLRPTTAVLLNLEPDHFDCYPDTAALDDSFARFIANVAADGLLLVNEASPAAQHLASRAPCRVERFGLGAHADYRATRLSSTAGCYRFRFVGPGTEVDVSLQVPGRHQVTCALAAAAVAASEQVEWAAIAAGLQSFAGLQRRLEVLLDSPQLAVIDDYAHHPTEVTAALDAVRERYPGRRLICVFQPHQASRLGRLIDDFARSLTAADLVAVAQVYRAREGAPTSGEATAADLCQRLAASGVPILQEHRSDAILERVHGEICSGDVVLILGAGDIGKLAHGLVDRIRAVVAN